MIYFGNKENISFRTVGKGEGKEREWDIDGKN